MNTNKKLALRWPLLAGYLGTIMLMLACMVFSGAQLSENGLFRLNNNVVEVKNDSGNWVPVGGASFELVGGLESTDPWVVAGTTLETRETTQIDEGLEVGDLVRVRGVVLEDDTWVAYSIERAEEQTDPIIVLIGTVDSMDPWVVNGIELNVTDETDIQGEITTGMIVRVEILLAPDGTWEVISIAPLSNNTETSGCATVIATVVNVSGNEIQFLGWPSTVIFQPATGTESTAVSENDNEDNDDQGDDENEDNDDTTIDITTLNADQVVQAVVCVSDDGQLVIVQIVVLNIDDNGTSVDNGEKVLICHKPNKKGGHTLSLPQAAIPAHLGHGDILGACP